MISLNSSREAGYLSLLLLATIGACGPENDQNLEPFTTSDSSGAVLATSRAPLWQDDGWVVGKTPVLVIETPTQSDLFVLDRVRGVVSMREGQLMVANGGTSELLTFNKDAALINRQGRPGQGPQEFGTIWDMHPISEDSVAVLDFGNRRIAIATPRVLSSSLPPLNSANPWRVFPISDGRFAVPTIEPVPVSAPTGVHREASPVLLVDRSGRVLDTIVTAPGPEEYLGRSESGRVIGSIPLFNKETFVAARGERLYVGDGTYLGYDVYALNGTLVKRVRVDIEIPRVSQEMIVRETERRGSRGEDWELLESLPRPEFLPAFSDLVVDDLSYVWLRTEWLDTPERATEDSTTWQVFSPEGRWMGSVSLPDRFKPYHIGHDFLAGVSENRFGAEAIIRYFLQRKTANPQ